MLDLKDGQIVIDATAGRGGHSEAILKEAKVELLSIDADEAAVAHTRERLSKLGNRAHDTKVAVGNFSDIKRVAHAHGLEHADRAFFDLGWNMTQLEAGRGFSFLTDEPLNMSYGAKPASGFTAAEILNSWEEKTIADVLFGYGEERYARRIARAVVERRKIKPIETTLEFVEIIKDSVPALYRHGRLHPATRSFQALRIAVNDELGVLEKGLTDAWHILNKDGKIAVITFHSIEDRAVKRLFAKWASGGSGTLLTKKPLTATKEEITRNPPSRSAKLRGITKN
jgi:16S rRNA (cytosine1402-N4)-methyltransferase